MWGLYDDAYIQKYREIGNNIFLTGRPQQEHMCYSQAHLSIFA